eukprot:TRINITY_DN49816_c0_g1_i1.p1 TRINITY_DN49816_c0_g1~~TRINITY_DN49816_c0_g1_i1.p1  ORF type:complete len:521 (-),score=118.69 TRINITY_DN49816_c0_g1_i1:129-1691(-)
MLSVLTSSTVRLEKELSNSQKEGLRLRSQNSSLRDALDRRTGYLVRQVASAWNLVTLQEKFALMRMAFLGLAHCRHHSRTYWSSSKAVRRRSQTTPPPAWIWLWRRKVLRLWRRCVDLERLGQLRLNKEEAASAHAAIVCRLESEREDLRLRLEAKDRQLDAERERSSGLETLLAEAREQVAGLQGNLKESYVRQFEDARQKQVLQEHVSALLQDVEQTREQKRVCSEEVIRHREQLAKQQALRAHHEKQLEEATGELSLAEEVIDDITSSKCVGLRRFFENYNIPSVLLALFRRTMELQGQLRVLLPPGPQPTLAAVSLRAGGSQGIRSSLSRGSLCSSGAEQHVASPSNHSPMSPATATALTAACLQSLLDGEVREHVSLQADGRVSRNGLQVYVESLKLARVSPTMVTQVVLALLGLKLGDGSCEAARFTELLLSPPAWQHLDFATALWGAVGEPAAAVVQQHRRSRSGGVAAGCRAAAASAQVRAASPKAPTAPGRLAAAKSRQQEALTARQRGWM